MAFYTVRSERLFCEQLGYNLLFRWFLDMSMVDAPFEHSAFSHNRERLLKHDVAGEFFRAIVEQARAARLLSHEHFTVDGTLIDAWASLKSFRNRSEDRRDPPDDPGNPTVNFHGEKRSNTTHASTTDPEAKLMRKGKNREARLSYAAHALMENRNGLLVDFRVTQATGTAEHEAALAMLDARKERNTPITLGADKGYDAHAFVAECRAMNVVPHVAQGITQYRGSNIDGRTTRHPGYAISQRIRKRVEEIFGWAKTVGNFRKTRFIGIARTQLAAYLVGAAYNLLRITKLLPNPSPSQCALT
jgi:IS5 family transposase